MQSRLITDNNLLEPIIIGVIFSLFSGSDTSIAATFNHTASSLEWTVEYIRSLPTSPPPQQIKEQAVEPAVYTKDVEAPAGGYKVNTNFDKGVLAQNRYYLMSSPLLTHCS
jgi:hypothetical protein